METVNDKVKSVKAFAEAVLARVSVLLPKEHRKDPVYSAIVAAYYIGKRDGGEEVVRNVIKNFENRAG